MKCEVMGCRREATRLVRLLGEDTCLRRSELCAPHAKRGQDLAKELGLEVVLGPLGPPS